MDNTTMPNCCQKWEDKCNSTFQWKTIFHKIQKIKEIKLKWLQMRIIHRIIATNIVLKEMKIVNQDMCAFCKLERETIEHVFWQCPVTKAFWTSIQVLLNEKCLHVSNLQFSQSLVLFGVEINVKTDKILDQIILTAKSFIYACKVKEKSPNLRAFIEHLQYRYKVDEYNAKISLELQAFQAEWVRYQPIFVN